MRVCRCQSKKGKFARCRKGMKKVCYTARRPRRRR